MYCTVLILAMSDRSSAFNWLARRWLLNANFNVTLLLSSAFLLTNCKFICYLLTCTAALII
jgi:hypothetical protein